MSLDPNREEAVRVEDVAPLGSRVSWGAIFAGAVMAVAISLVMSLLGAAVGITIAGEVEPVTITWAAGLWAIVTMIVALFVGGWVTTQCSVGETQAEAVVHGIIMWGVAIFFLLWLGAFGFNLGLATTAAVTTTAQRTTWQQMAVAAGVPVQDVRALEAETAAETRQEAAMQAAWWSLFGAILSIAAAIGGAILGAGPTPRLLIPGYARERPIRHRGAMPGGA